MEPGDRQGSVLLLGNHRQTLAVLRSLDRQGYRTHLGLGPSDARFAARSRAAHQTWPHPDLSAASDDELLTAIADALPKCEAKGQTRRFVFPIGETEIRRCAALAPRLPHDVTLVVANQAALEVCLDKTRSADVFDRLAIPQAETRSVGSTEELEQAAVELGFPVVVKSAGAPTEFLPEKALIFPDREGLQGYRFADWPADLRLLVQRQAQGKRHNVYFAAAGGKILALVEVRIDRTDRINDAGLAVEGTTTPPTSSLREHCDRFVAEVDYQGVGCLQFLVDEATGRFAILEVNPRLGANCAIVISAGLDLPSLALPLAAGEAPPTLPSKFRDGLRYAWFIGEVDGIRHSLGQGHVGLSGAIAWLMRSIGRALTADTHVTWSWRDPLPSLLLFGDFVGGFAHSLAGRLLRAGRRRAR